MTHPTPTPRTDPTAAGFTLIEAVMSILIVGLMLVAALNTVGAAKLSQHKHHEAVLGPMLAEDLLAEILGQAYEEPVDTAGFGLEGEDPTSRATWDDVDDYHGWSATPPVNRDGSEVAGAEGWTRKVSVRWVEQDSLSPSNTATGLKQVDVEVIHNGRTVAALTALRTYAWPDQGTAGDAQAAPSSDGGASLLYENSGESSKDFFKGLFE